MTAELSHQLHQNLTDYYKNSSQIFMYKDIITMCLGGVSSVAAATFVHPIDTFRIKLQLQKPMVDGSVKYKSLISGLRTICMEEGAGRRGLYKGIEGQFCLQGSYSMVRYGTYEPVKRLIGADEKDASLLKKFVAGGTAGFLAAGFSNPADLIKTRMQAEPAGTHNSMGWHIRDIHKSRGGWAGFYKGVNITLVRAVLCNSSYLGSYDAIKHYIMDEYDQPDGIPVQFLASFFAGFAVALATTPADNIKSRLMNQKSYQQLPTLSKMSMAYYKYYPKEKYRGIYDCAKKMLMNEGFSSFYRGFASIWSGFVPFSILSILIWEQMRYQCGMEGI